MIDPTRSPWRGMTPHPRKNGYAILSGLGLPLSRAVLFFAASILLLLSGCGIQPTRISPDATTVPLFRPPTLAATITPTHVPEPTHTAKDAESDAPAAGQSCTDSLSYKADVTIPDGTEVVASSTLDKRWEITNSGTCNWNDRYRLHLESGPSLGSPEDQALFPARGGTDATIRMTLTAPAEAGKVHTVWRAYNPDGQSFGDPIYIDFVVK